MSKKNGKIKMCIVCGMEYYVRADRCENSKYCSKKCWNNRRVLKKCEYCENDIISYHGKKYCSRECSHKAMVGEKSPAWIDGKSLERDRAREGTKLKEWRICVFKKDYFACQKCGSTKDLQAHHIKEWAKFEDLRFDINNGLTVCIECHGKLHNRDFTKRDNKFCIDCGKKTKLPKSFCHSCSTKRQWEKRRNPY